MIPSLLAPTGGAVVTGHTTDNIMLNLQARSEGSDLLAGSRRCDA